MHAGSPRPLLSARPAASPAGLEEEAATHDRSSEHPCRQGEAPPTILEGILPFDKARLPTEVIAGATLAALAMPEVMGYSKIAEMPVITGLYTLVLPMLAFALFGSRGISWSAPIRPRPPSSRPGWPASPPLLHPAPRNGSPWPALPL